MHIPHSKEFDYYKRKDIVAIQRNHYKPKN